MTTEFQRQHRAAKQDVEPPPDLSAEARRWWVEIFQSWRLDPHERLLFETACRQFDEVRRLERRVRRFGFVQQDRWGRVVTRPEAGQLRDARRTLLDICKQLRFEPPTATVAFGPFGPDHGGK